SAGSMVLFLRVWQPAERLTGDVSGPRPAIAGAAAYDAGFESEVRRRDDDHPDSRGEIFAAYAPYLIVIVVFALAQWGPIKDFLAKGSTQFDWPGLNVVNAKGEAPSSVIYKFNWLPAAGTLLLISGLLTMAALRISPARAVH